MEGIGMISESGGGEHAPVVVQAISSSSLGNGKQLALGMPISR